MFSRVIFLILMIAVTQAFAQTTEFTYQGQLQNSSLPANGVYDFEFVLFDAASGGVQSTPVLPRSGVTVTNGIFAVILDFGIAGFLGPARYLEIRVREAGGGAFTTLGPRQIVSSSPYAIKSLSAATATNSLSLGGVAADQFVQTDDPRLADARPPTPGSPSYIQNTTTVQATSSFSISGNGTAAGRLTANSLHGQTEIRMGGSGGYTLISDIPGSLFIGAAAGHSSTGTNNTMVGPNAGSDSTTGTGNSFFGTAAGQGTTTANDNSFFGYLAGQDNNGSDNSFFGSGAGQNNTTGENNTFVGRRAGTTNTSGLNNTFVGGNAGAANTFGSGNAFFGLGAGTANTFGGENSFFGRGAGAANTGGDFNSFFGADAGANSTTGRYNTFIGRAAGMNNSSGLFNAFFGERSGDENSTGGSNTFVGREAGHTNTTGSGNTFVGIVAGQSNTTGSNNTTIGLNADVGSTNLNFATAIGADSVVSNSNTVVLGRSADTVRVPGNFASVGVITTNSGLTVLGSSNLIGIVDLGTLGAAGSQSICRNASGQISTCSSSLRYKTSIKRFGLGLNLINQLKPITFDWKDGGMHDLGFGAEDVAAIEPLLVTYNTKGEVEGVKYDRIGVVLVNAVKEQQQTIERQQKQIEALKALVCNSNREAAFCKEMP